MRRAFTLTSDDSGLPFPIIDSVALVLKRKVDDIFFYLTKKVPSSSLFGHAHIDLFTSFFTKIQHLGEKWARAALGDIFLSLRRACPAVRTYGLLGIIGHAARVRVAGS